MGWAAEGAAGSSSLGYIPASGGAGGTEACNVRSWVASSGALSQQPLAQSNRSRSGSLPPTTFTLVTEPGLLIPAERPFSSHLLLLSHLTFANSVWKDPLPLGIRKPQEPGASLGPHGVNFVSCLLGRVSGCAVCSPLTPLLSVLVCWVVPCFFPFCMNGQVLQDVWGELLGVQSSQDDRHRPLDALSQVRSTDVKPSGTARFPFKQLQLCANLLPDTTGAKHTSRSWS